MTKQGDVRLGAFVALAYGLVYYALRATPSFINLSAGLSLTLFLFSSRRLWPAYLVGQLLGATFASWGRYGQAPYSGTWLAAVIFLPLIVSFGTAVMARRNEDAVPFFGLRDATRFLGIAALGSLALGIAGLFIASTLTVSLEALYGRWPKVLWLYTSGAFVGAVVMAPMVASIRDRVIASRSWKGFLTGIQATCRRHFMASLQVIGYCVPAVIIAQLVTSQDVLWVVRFAMMLPLLAMVAHNGARPIAFALPCVTLALGMTQGSELRAPDLLVISDLAALVGGIVLVFTMHVTEQRAIARSASIDAREWRRSAQARAHLPGSIRRQHAAELDRIYSCISQAESALRRDDLDRAQAAKIWWRTITHARHQLRAFRDSIAPPILIGHGLRAALAASPVVHDVAEAGGSFHSHTAPEARELSLTIQETVYHVATQATYLLLSLGNPGRVAVRVRVGTKAGRRWTVVTVKAHVGADLDEAAEAQVRYTEAAIKELAKVARAYGGTLHRHDFGGRQVISALMVEDAAEIGFGISKKRAGER